jgi:hypothetical protein
MYDAIGPVLLQRWQNFYVMVGSSSAALIGLQFVVLALVTQLRIRNSPSGIGAFSTPTIVYFGNVLLLAAVVCAPWSGLAGAGVLITLCGAAGTVYTGLVVRRATRQTDYRLVAEDWLWHIVLPFSAHAMLLAAGLTLVQRPVPALFTMAAAVLVLLFTCIHNAWDTVTYMVINHFHPRRQDDQSGDPQHQPPPPPAA